MHEATLYSDSAVAVEGFLDRAFASQADKPYASLWRRIKFAADELEGVSLSVVKVPAHLSKTRALERGATAFHRWQGNDWADALAKRGAKLHEDRPQARARGIKMTTILVEVLPFFGRLLKRMVDFNLLPSRPPPFATKRPPAIPKHVVTTFGDEQQSRCCRCLRFAAKGSVQADCMPRMGRRHHLCAIGSGLFCSVCGSYSFGRTRNLSQACGGPPAARSYSIRYLTRLLAGQHPVSRKFLGPPQDLWAGALALRLSD